MTSHGLSTSDSLRQHLRDELSALDLQLKKTLDSEVVLIRSIADYIVSAGGKRLRPMLVFLAAQALRIR